MCRNIRPLFNFAPPVTDDEIHGASLQFVRKVSGFAKPSKVNEAAFDRAVHGVAHVVRHLMADLHTNAEPRDRAVEAARATARAAKRFALIALAALGLAAAPAPAAAQTPTREADVATIDGMIRAFYEVISGPAGRPREWGRDSSLYIPGVRFVAMTVRDGRPVASVTDHAQYIAGSDRFFVENGFFEEEIHRVTRRFGNIVHVFSTYQHRRTVAGPIQGRGVNSIQLYWDGRRWWIANATWDGERPDNPIPPELLPAR